MGRFLTDPTVSKVLDYLVKLGVIEPKEAALSHTRKLEVLKKSRQDTLQTHLGTEAPQRAQSSSLHVQKKYGAKKRVTAQHIYTPVEKFYTFFGGRLVMRHWRKEVWFGIPVRVWIFIYLLAGACLIYGVHNYFNIPNDIYSDRFKDEPKYKHIQFCVEKINLNEKVLDMIGMITKPKVSKLTPSDRHSFRTKYVTEVLAEAEKYGNIRMLLIYSTGKTLDALQRIELQMDDEIMRINFKQLEDRPDYGNKDFDNLEVIVCPPDLFPLMHWFTESRRETFAGTMRYIWPMAPAIALAAMLRWHFRAPAGLANYILAQSKEHVIVRRALGSPVHLQSDQWRGKLTSRSCNMRILLEGNKHKGKVHIVGYRDGSKRWLFPNCVLMIDGVKHDHYREMSLPPFEVPTADM